MADLRATLSELRAERDRLVNEVTSLTAQARALDAAIAALAALVGEAPEVTRRTYRGPRASQGSLRSAVLDALGSCPQGVRLGTLAATVNRTPQNMLTVVVRLCSDGEVVRIARGTYALARFVSDQDGSRRTDRGA